MLQKIFFQETIAQERVECHDRIDRRAIRERIAIDRHSAARSALLRQEMINLFEQSLKGMEERHRLDIDNRYGQSKNKTISSRLMCGGVLVSLCSSGSDGRVTGINLNALCPSSLKF